MNILRKLGILKSKSDVPPKVIPVEDIKKEQPPEVDGYSRIAEFQKTGIPYFLRLERSGSKRAVGNIDIHSFQVTDLRDMMAREYGGDTYIGTLVDGEMKSVLLKGGNTPETYIFRVDGPPIKPEKPKQTRDQKADGFTAGNLKEILALLAPVVGPYLLKYLESRGDTSEKTLSMAKELMQITAGPSIQDIFTMITGVLGETTKIQGLTNPTPPITTGDGAGALGQTNWMQQFMNGLGAGLAPVLQGLMSGAGNNKPAAIGQGAGQQQTGQPNAPKALPPPDIAGKLIEMANRNEAPAIIAEQIVTLLDGYRRSTDPLFPQFAHYLENPQMAFDTILRLFPVLSAWDGRADRLRESVYEICDQIRKQEEGEEEPQNELYPSNSETRSDADGPGVFDEAPVGFSEPVEPDPPATPTATEPSEEDPINSTAVTVGGDEDEDQNRPDDGGPGQVHSEEHTGQAGQDE